MMLATYLNDIVLDRVVNSNSFLYKLTGSVRRQNHSLSYRVGVSYRDYQKLSSELPKAEVKRNGDYQYLIKQGHLLYKVLDRMFTDQNSGDSYYDSKTGKVIHIYNKEVAYD